MEVLESGQISLEISLFPCTALMSFAELPAGLGIPGGRAPRVPGSAAGGARAREPLQAKELCLANQAAPTPLQKIPHLLCVASRPAWTLQTFPKAKVMAGESFPNFDHWPCHQTAQNVSLLGSSKEKSPQQAHMTVVGQGDHPAAA